MTGWTDAAREASLEVREAHAKDHNANGAPKGQETHHDAMKGAQMTRQHFVAAANQLRESGASPAAVNAAADRFAQTNKNFDRSRFVAAATKGLTQGRDIRSQYNKGYDKATRVVAPIVKESVRQGLPFKPVPAGIAARYHSALAKGYVPASLAAQYHSALAKGR